MRIVSTILAALLGILLGGVVNLVLYRLPRERLLFRRPHCVGCGRPLTWEALPLIGYVLQRGRGRQCQQPLPAFFPLVELLSGTVLAILTWRLGITVLTGLYAFFSLALILTLFLDWQHRYIYYAVIIPGTTVALLAHLLLPFLNIAQSLLGLAVGTAFFGLLFIFGQVLFRSQALGLGDVMLAAMIGAMTGFYGGLMALTGGMLLAGLVGGVLLLIRKTTPGGYMPYGAYLCIGTLAYLCLWAP